MRGIQGLLVLAVAGLLAVSCTRSQQENLAAAFAKPRKNAAGEIIIEPANQPTQAELRQVSKKSAPADGIDIDLTKMTSTMIYAEVFNMLVEPDYYKGKTIRMSGLFQVYTNLEENEQYFAVIIPDAAACCQQGIEFMWRGEHRYPEDYPQIGQEITATGVYTLATMPDDIEYVFLDVDKLVF